MNGTRFAILLLVVLAGCGKAMTPGEREVRIRYVNMGIIFEYMVRTDLEAQKITRQREELTAMAARVEKEIREAGDAPGRRVMEKNLAEARADLEKLRSSEELHKQRLLNEINRAMDLVASRLQVDYIFNTGDSLVYFKKDFDVTELVIREIIALKKRNAPVSR